MGSLLDKWLETLATTYAQTRGMSGKQREIYKLALVDLNEHLIEIGFRRVLRKWQFANLLPPPAFIRECAVAALEEEEYLSKPKPPPTDTRLSIEEAWDDWDDVQRITRDMHEKLGIVARAKRIPIPPAIRLAELRQQAEEVIRKYGGKTLGVCGVTPSETEQGASGTQRETKKPVDRSPDGSSSGKRE